MSSLSCFNGSFINSDTMSCDEQNAGVDFEMAKECFEIISKIEHPSILDTVSIHQCRITYDLCLASVII